MKYAIVESQKREAAKGLKGFCPICGLPVRPKCGKYKINHWAHISNENCDKWWENETEWHRNWKDKFPRDWQEIIAYDEENDEKHIADIKTDLGMVIEIQHSFISDEERLSREKFFKNMIWIVDGTRRKSDYKHFIEANRYNSTFWRISPDSPIYIIELSHFFLPKEWLNSSVPVIFDFRGLLDNDYENYNQLREPLWCLLPNTIQNKRIVIEYPRDSFVQQIKTDGLTFNIKDISDKVYQAINKKNIERRIY